MSTLHIQWFRSKSCVIGRPKFQGLLFVGGNILGLFFELEGCIVLYELHSPKPLFTLEEVQLDTSIYERFRVEVCINCSGKYVPSITQRN